MFLQHPVPPLRISKHRQFDDKGQHIPGRLRVSRDSSLRKMMRAARRGAVPNDRLFTIVEAMKSAQERAQVYMNTNSAARLRFLIDRTALRKVAA